MVWRDLRNLGTVASNNFFLFCFLLLGQAGGFLQLILGLVLLFPLTVDPLAKIPKSRLASWPLSKRDRVWLRLASLALSPALWITLGLLVWGARNVMGGSFALIAVPCLILNAVLAEIPKRLPDFHVLRYIPALPGRMGGLVRKNLREMLQALDLYPGLVLTAVGVAYRLLRNPQPDALMMLTLLSILSISTYAQRLFAFDSEELQNRYRLLPLHGWQTLLAKDIAFLIIAMLLALPLAPLTGLAAALAVLAVGHHASVLQPAVQARWRFTGGAALPVSMLQVVLMFGAGTAVFRGNVLWLLPCVLGYLASLWWYGRELAT